MPDYTRVLERLLNTPLLAHPDKAEIVAGVVLRRAGIDVHIDVDAGSPMAGPLQERRLRELYEGADGKCFLFDPERGIAVIEVTGSLAHRQWRIGESPSGGVMGYDGIGAQLDAAIEDPDVGAIVFDIHSAGGEVAGAFALGDRIYRARSEKPIIAIADEMAFSAGYVIAAACEQVWLAHQTAEVGSVGVVMVHFSFEEMLAADGVKPTIIQAGAYKADGNPYEDLPEDARARFQEKIDAIYDVFVQRVALWRGMGEAAVRMTEAGIYMGQEAVGVGFADGIRMPEDIMDDLAAETRASRPLMRAV